MNKSWIPHQVRDDKLSTGNDKRDTGMTKGIQGIVEKCLPSVIPAPARGWSAFGGKAGIHL
ncbi:MAG: hypothetical protein A3G32_00255 [Deltaproteobacteria bacterium RIFCSPLOWO2_12_FULL_40_28]|nr:MAG: hypothetical protein A3C45_07510 [Deltaproteobacteria bacterium RIFCSPHIGHO2_02_FULL_40_28]OGQ20605.1 MAG: hypothetical protein A3E27_08755 [Deltaproteobacteria bacterium RIFCSPHIGHO2_12_FULL_40_32]OGQ41263.1 MAG: hypothetical protein A3I69_04305 [Deltaproteobacteria bacterium RIFCSPLOWO2_02_FULL_40_36]OGQ53607.1 MAG: hypothetical protein A3G32_00255 [Deltaproteobacteria bacterium RIFCSPLOWO2_12_FULL_40_28]